MEKFVIKGGCRLLGEVTISGAKNAAVAIIPAVILAEEPCVLENVPNINDVFVITHILHEMGADVKILNKSTLAINSSNIAAKEVSYEMTRHIRASYYLMGALLGRFGKACVSLPGGCDFGVRPIDQHIKGFEALGAKVSLEHGMVSIEADELVGGQVFFDVVSVGATMNIMLAAVKARGMTVIENAAREPHIVDLANFLNSMGADVMGAGTSVIKVRGVQKMHGASYSIIPDQIEAGTYMVAAAATGGNVLIKNVIPKHLEPISVRLRKMGVIVDEYDDAVRVFRKGGDVMTVNVKTMPHPGFPTDMQPQITMLLSVAQGTSIVTEGVWDNRFRYVDELRRMGAKIQVDGKVAVIEGVEELTAAPVRATDLRAGAAMMIAGLVAKGVTEIEDIYHIERGYEDMQGKLSCLGAEIKKINDFSKSALTAAL
ncbi:MAG: UDP-N-acetylglucosamine 1-carboxyvinyltransferase [Oscillospiraceae bacterium]|nr:UDP-N-acetylglucosamine 1-carboxyvinyltransferase [Oscillospiraceae bacterium]